MIRNVAVSTFVLAFIQHVNFVCGQNNSAASSIQSHLHITSVVSTSKKTSGVRSTSTFSTDLRGTTTIAPSVTISDKLESSTLQSESSRPSVTGTENVPLSTFASSTSIYSNDMSSTFYPTKSSVNPSGSVLKTSLNSGNSHGYATSSSRFPSSSTASSAASIIHSSTAVTTSSIFQNVHSTSARMMSSSKTTISTTVISSATLETSSNTLVRPTSLFSSSLNSFTVHTFSTSEVPTTNKPVVTTITSYRESSTISFSSPPQETIVSRSHETTLSQIISSTPRLLMTSSSNNSSLRSTEITTVRSAQSRTPSLRTTKTSIKNLASSSSIKVLQNIFLEFDGKLVVSPKSLSNEYYNNFKKLSGSVESILDEALKEVNGYIYSKVLSINTRENKSKFECSFKLFLRQPSSETASTLVMKIKKYNETEGFGQFTLHSVATSVPCDQSSSKKSLYLWAIVVIAVLGALCLVLLAAFVYTRRKLKKKRNQSLANQDNNSNNLRYKDFFPSVFDGNDDSQNVPLQLTSVSPSDSKKPLRISDEMDTDTDPEEENGKKSDKSSFGENGIKEDKSSAEEPAQPSNVTLHVQDADDEDDQTKFSTFSRKR